jgi:hypothetical protein
MDAGQSRAPAVKSCSDGGWAGVQPGRPPPKGPAAAAREETKGSLWPFSHEDTSTAIIRTSCPLFPPSLSSTHSFSTGQADRLDRRVYLAPIHQSRISSFGPLLDLARSVVFLRPLSSSSPIFSVSSTTF